MSDAREEFKRRTVMAHQEVLKADNFVETGTALGEMCEAAHPHFRKVVTIEKHKDIADAAASRLALLSNVRVVHGDSVEKLPGVLKGLSGSTLFWLDAHEEAKTGIPSPVIEELYAIKDFILPDSAVLIDDIRIFGTHGWPTTERLLDVLRVVLPGRTFVLHDDIARAIPRRVFDAIYRGTPAL